SAPTRLTNNPTIDWQPAFSADGSKLVFSSFRDGDYELYLMNADGTDQTRLTNYPGTDWQPSFSPDGSKIAFASARDGDYDIYVMNADGTGLVNVTDNLVEDLGPVWSPDGTKLAFMSTRFSLHHEIHVMNADGSGTTRVTFGSMNANYPDWSPDGTKLVFERSQDVVVVNADGSGSPVYLKGSVAADLFPVFSPDGLSVLVTSNRDGNLELYQMANDGSSVLRLTNVVAADFYADWAAIPAPPPPPPPPPPDPDPTPVPDPDPVPVPTADASATTDVNGQMRANSGQKVVGVVVRNVGTEAITTTEVSMLVKVNGQDAPGTVQFQNPPMSVTLQPGESYRFVFKWEYGKATLSVGDVVLYTGAVRLSVDEVGYENNVSIATETVV
ncbi:MAG: hypothetical protein ACRD1T_17155, partial [Acidimicrobiia bacterium]